MTFNHLAQPLRQPSHGLHVNPRKVRLAPNVVPRLHRRGLSLWTNIRREVEQAIEDIRRSVSVCGGDDGFRGRRADRPKRRRV
jgi:hypothetical protein